MISRNPTRYSTQIISLNLKGKDHRQQLQVMTRIIFLISLKLSGGIGYHSIFLRQYTTQPILRCITIDTVFLILQLAVLGLGQQLNAALIPKTSNLNKIGQPQPFCNRFHLLGVNLNPFLRNCIPKIPLLLSQTHTSLVYHIISALLWLITLSSSELCAHLYPWSISRYPQQIPTHSYPIRV